MNQTVSVLKIVVWAVVALIAIAILFGIVFGNSFFGNWGSWGSAYATGGNDNMNYTASGEWEVLTDETFPADDINSIEIQGRSENIRVLPSTDGQFRVYETLRMRGMFSGRPDPALISTGGGVFRLEGSPNRINWVMMGSLQHNIDIYIPQTEWERYTAKISSGRLDSPDITAGEIRIGCSSGEVYASRLTSSGKLTLEMSSGDINVSNASAQRTDVNVTSGDFDLDTLTTDELNVEITSGNANVKNAVAKSVYGRASSGEIDLSGSFNNVVGRITSGDLDITTDVQPDSVELEASSGGISLSLPHDSVFSVDYRKSSGDIHSDFNHDFGGRSGKTGQDGPTYRVEITSGEIEFRSGR